MHIFRKFQTIRVLTFVALFFANITSVLGMCDDHLFSDYKECTKYSSFCSEKTSSAETSLNPTQNGGAALTQKNSWFSIPRLSGGSCFKFIKQRVLKLNSTKNARSLGKARLPIRVAHAETREDTQEQPPQRTVRILTIDGGGVRGIIPAKILSDMETCIHHDFQSDMHLAEYFDFMAGTSTGGIIALGLNVPDKENNYRPKITSNDLFKLYKNHGAEIFPTLSFLSNFQNYMTAKYDEGPLEKLLQERFGSAKLGHSIAKILITAYDGMQDLPIFFKSYDKQKSSFAMKHVARATAAAPTYLSGAEIKDSQGIKHHYIDGGVFANNPTFEALLEVRRLESEGPLPPATRYVILSLGTGECPSSSYWDKIRTAGKLPWAKVLPFLMMNAAEKLTQQHLKIYIEDLEKKGIKCEYVRIQPTIPSESAELDDASPTTLKTLIAKAQEISDKHRDVFVKILRDYHKESTELENFYTNQNNPISFYTLGMLKKKEGKIEEAIQWLTKAAEQQHTEAQYMLAWLNEHHSTRKDKAQAQKWYTAAANQGHREALYKLGRLSSTLNEKKGFLEKAAQQGHMKAPYQLGLICDQEGNENEAERRYKEAANRRYVKALDKLGLIFSRKGRIREAEKHFKDAIESGYEPAEIHLENLHSAKPTLSNKDDSFSLGVKYYYAQGVTQDYGEAFKQFSKAAKEGSIEAQNWLGVLYYNGQGVPKDEKTAVEWFTKAADRGDARGLFNVGIMYESGLGGLPKDENQAIEFYKKAAGKGQRSAQYALGTRYANGQGVLKDEKTAVEWYTKAAEQGHAGAQNNLAIMYEDGQGGLPKDQKKAIVLFTKAAEQGLKEAQFTLGLRYANGQGVLKDEKTAVEWYTKAADLGHADAQNNLGVMYVKGQGVPKDEKIAVEWYTKAADQGERYAQSNLGVCYYKGRGVPKDDKKAIGWFLKAAEQNQRTAQFYLGKMYENGQGGLVKNDKEAIEFYTKSAEQGKKGAQYYLGKIYENGQGVPKDEETAIKWYTKAADQGHENAKTALARLKKK